MKKTIIIVLLVLSQMTYAENYHLFKYDAVETANKYYSLGEPYWEPSQEQIDNAFAQIRNRLKNSESEKQILKKYENYMFQVVGHTKNSKKTIFINAFCGDKAYWQKSIVFVFDGGDCYWQVNIDAESNKIIEFMVNGQA